MPPSKFNNPDEQRKAEKKRWETKHRSKPVLGDKVKAREQKNRNPQGERFHSGDY